MILRSLSEARPMPDAPGAASASEVFIETQKDITTPYALIFQAAHSKLAGDIATLFKPDVFGQLPNQVIRAVGEHDFGWQESDQSQIDALHQRPPRAFPSLSTEETMPSWNKSIEHGCEMGSLEYVIVSRHFTFLGRSDPARAEFLASETMRRENVERALPFGPEELERWTAAIGFADLLSLYLCSGSNHPVEFPVAHPADPKASGARKVTLSWNGGTPVFAPSILQSGAAISLSANRYNEAAGSLEPITFSWSFAQG